MGGGHHFHYPKYVWSPSGGWWPNPAHWKRNTFVAGASIAVLALCIVAFGESKKVRRGRCTLP